MNIKEAIERGLYPKDEKGRALVPQQCGDTVTIYATDVPGDEPIVGFDGESVETWAANGKYGSSSARCDLLPPPPRKVKVTRWAVVRIADQAVMDTASTESGAASSHARYHFHDMHKFRVVELSGEIEEPWS